VQCLELTTDPNSLIEQPTNGTGGRFQTDLERGDHNPGDVNEKGSCYNTTHIILGTRRVGGCESK